MRIIFVDEISKPPVIVFPWIADPEKAMKWQKNVKEGKIIKRNIDIIGTTFIETIEEDGKALQMEGIITQYRKDELIGFHINSKIHNLDVNYSLDDEKEGTRITIEAMINWKFPMNIISLFISNKMKTGILEQLQMEVAELKKIMESQ